MRNGDDRCDYFSAWFRIPIIQNKERNADVDRYSKREIVEQSSFQGN